ncbi:YjfI family protein [Marinibactrum halimedae]|uniref:DUF2170 family protein n=1 Tax=Marinibactrum halimedae TaxID=1444977 RepID=A0AA37WQC3_9GAMM|nr:YjfI family protein [Marinibactrum halimedae]MCD9460528.1 YjfI family protein [Marinibactrum halimedae]GLS27891.1 hypothetical protein GCM10007877_36100 [Marinibactrum halimedae]
MNRKSSAHYQREYRRRLREQGLVKKEVWILPENAQQLSVEEKRLREPMAASLELSNSAGMAAACHRPSWTTERLFQALQQSELASRVALEHLEGNISVLLIVMNEFGGLPLFLSIVGEQMLVEGFLWSANDVKDVAAFNTAILKTHKYFPLSTISLDPVDGQGDCYHMFGALSATSLLENVILEIEVLAANIIQATEAYSEFLTT